MIYVPFEFQGDGRKREAKRHKSHTVVPRDEIDLDSQMRERQNSDPKIIALEEALEELKNAKMSKRELQSSRNRLTAQLSRDRQKIELNFLKTQCINYQRLLRRLNKKLEDAQYFCENCNTRLSDTLHHHQTNLFVRTENEYTIQPSEHEPKLKKARNDRSESELEEASLPKTPKKNTELKRSKIQILVGRKRNHFATAGALIASVSMIALSGSDKPATQQLQEFNHQEVPLLNSNVFDLSLAYSNPDELSLDIGRADTSKQMFTSFSNQLIPVSACPQQVCKPNPNHYFSLSDTYMAYDVRESYLQRQSVGTPAETTYLTTGEFQTKTCNVWRSDEQEIYPAHQLDLYDGATFGDRVSKN